MSGVTVGSGRAQGVGLLPPALACLAAKRCTDGLVQAVSYLTRPVRPFLESEPLLRRTSERCLFQQRNVQELWLLYSIVPPAVLGSVGREPCGTEISHAQHFLHCASNIVSCGASTATAFAASGCVAEGFDHLREKGQILHAGHGSWRSVSVDVLFAQSAGLKCLLGAPTGYSTVCSARSGTRDFNRLLPGLLPKGTWNHKYMKTVLLDKDPISESCKPSPSYITKACSSICLTI